MDVVDFPAKPATLELCYTGLERTQKQFSYKPLVFKKLDYIIVNLAAQTLITSDATRAPVISAVSNILHFYIINGPRMLEIEDLVKTGKIVHLSAIKWSKWTTVRIAKLRRQAGKMMMNG